MKMYIKPIKKDELNEYLAIPDLTTPNNHHAIRLLYQKIKEYMTISHPNSEIKEYRLSPIVKVEDNYDNLLIDKDNISRSSTYTHYVDKQRVLRTHTSAQIPIVLKELGATKSSWKDVIIMLPGLVYRRDVTDKKHLGVIHQIEMWRVVKNSYYRKLVRQDLIEVINGLSKVCAPGWKKRNVNKIHPYTIEGIEVNLVKGSSDIEILEGGVINNQILKNAGLNHNEYSGWAMGTGLDRLVMTLKEIPDIRYLRSTNPRIQKQMADLSKYKEVSLMPAIVRDISYCVPQDYVEEDIHQEIRESIKNDWETIESIEITNKIPYKDLPKVISKRIGCKPTMKNILVRITLRHLEKTLTRNEANSLYNKIYLGVNYGKNIYLG